MSSGNGTADFAGSSKARQEIGLPGHCELCATVGHIAAHPDLGCSDVGCERAHGPGDGPTIRTQHGPPDPAVDLAAALDLLRNARCTYADPSLRMAWGRTRKALMDNDIDRRTTQ